MVYFKIIFACIELTNQFVLLLRLKKRLDSFNIFSAGKVTVDCIIHNRKCKTSEMNSVSKKAFSILLRVTLKILIQRILFLPII